MRAKKTACLGILGPLALHLGLLEHLIVPYTPLPPLGAQPGLSNIVTMYTACTLGFPGALYITLLKALFALITRGASAGFMSLCGGLLSTAAVCLVIPLEGKVFSFLGIGIIGAVTHNAGQLMAASLVSGTWALLHYGKYLLIFALITGSVTGTMLIILMPRLRKIGGIDNKNKTKGLKI